VKGASFLTDQKAERYSVPYYKTYHDGIYNQAIKGLPAAAICQSAAAADTCQPSQADATASATADQQTQTLFSESAFYDLPFLLNAHSFVRTDISGEHTTSFLKVADAGDRRGYRYDIVPNSRCKETIIKKLADADSYFNVANDIQGGDFIFDGDSIEIATRDFYKTTIEDCIQEFRNMRNQFIKNLNNAWTSTGLPAKFQPLRWMQANHPFAIYHSNPKNIGIFNNGTYHFNFTMPTVLTGASSSAAAESTMPTVLTGASSSAAAESTMPTQLGSNTKPASSSTFISRHQKAARYIQWLEPFLIANYGTADPLSKSTIMGHRFSAASQRGAVSRYIGIGSYDTRKMVQGKLNTTPWVSTRVTKEDGWMASYLRGCAYKPLEEVGMDINFHKHYNHGLELRFFDYFEEERLTSVLSTLVHVLDQSQTVTLMSAGDSALWNTIVEEVMVHGWQTQIYGWMAGELSAALALEIRPGPIRAVWHDIQRQLERQWLGRGECSQVMIRRRQYLWEHVERPLRNVQTQRHQSDNKISAPRTPKAIIPDDLQAEFQVQANPLVAKQRHLLPPEIPEAPVVGRNSGSPCVPNWCCTQ
jgi:hypothetical protein